MKQNEIAKQINASLATSTCNVTHPESSLQFLSAIFCSYFKINTKHYYSFLQLFSIPPKVHYLPPQRKLIDLANRRRPMFIVEPHVLTRIFIPKMRCNQSIQHGPGLSYTISRLAGFRVIRHELFRHEGGVGWQGREGWVVVGGRRGGEAGLDGGKVRVKEMVVGEM